MVLAVSAPEPTLVVLARMRVECERLRRLMSSARDRKRLALVARELGNLSGELERR
jgi:hypothetical protein